jgi:hypothetical protein
LAFWLYVSGGGSWSKGDRIYQGGPWEVDERTAQMARGSQLDWLQVVESERAPDVEAPLPLTGTLTTADLKLGTHAAALEAEAQLQHARAAEEETRAVAEQVGEEVGTVEETAAAELYACPHPGCEKAGDPYKSQPALDRHIQTKHAGVATAGPEAAEPEAEDPTYAPDHPAAEVVAVDDGDAELDTVTDVEGAQTE